MGSRGKRVCRILLAALFGLLGGCFGVSQNPVRFPYLLPTGDIIRTHAKPHGGAYYTDFDPHAIRLEVRPLDSTDPVRSEQVIVATVYDENGKPRRNRRIEWILEGAGNIIEVDESGTFPGRGYKVENKYAVSYTNYKEHTITRGTPDPNDDFTLRPGQSWCVISSAVEGDSYLTVYAPEIANWDARKVVVTKHWVDAEWTLPPPAVNRAGSEHVLTTRLVRRTDRQPLANYRVRYQILDGPPAVFLPTRTQEAVATSDLNGNANMTMVQVLPQPGINRIGIEIIRPPDPSKPSGVGITLFRGETTKEWQGPRISLNLTGPPTATVGQEMSYSATIANNSNVETQAMTVRVPLPEGMQLLRSEPRAIVEGNQLIWTFGVLPPGRTHALQMVLQSTRVGPVTVCASATTDEGIRDEKCVTTQILTPQQAQVMPPAQGPQPAPGSQPVPGAPPTNPGTQPPGAGPGSVQGGAGAPLPGQLNLNVTGPPTGSVGIPARFEVSVTNTGTALATNVVLSAKFDPELVHETRANPLDLQLGNLTPGQASAMVPLVLTPQKAGQFDVEFTASAAGGVVTKAKRTITVTAVQQPKMTMNMRGPKACYIDKPVTWDIQITNTGDVAINNLVVRDDLPPELTFLNASDLGQFVNGQVIWNLGTLAAHAQKTLQLTARCAKLGQRIINRAVATYDPNLQDSAEATLDIQGVPALSFDVTKDKDPVPVGDHVIYTVPVTNRGTLALNRVELTVILPKQLQVLSAEGGATKAVIQKANDQTRVTFPAFDGLAPQQTLNFRIEAQGAQAGDARITFELRKAPQGDPPITKQESTQVIIPPNGNGAPAPMFPR